MARTFVMYFGAGLGLALCELCFTLARGYGLFLTTRERLEYAAAAFTALPTCVALIGTVLARATSRPARGVAAARAFLSLLALGLAAVTGHLLSAGRRVRDLPSRYVWVAAGALAAGLGMWLLLRIACRVTTASPPIRRGFSVCFVLLAALCLALDGWLLPRGYPAFHMALFVLALSFSAFSATPFEREALFALPPVARNERRLRIAVLALSLLAPLALMHLARQPNASYATSERAPFTAKLQKPWLRISGATFAPTAQSGELSGIESAQGGVDLRDRDVLLITVDALRADLLRMHGGSGLTPEIDQLATQSLAFRHAYTAAPHTSYALTSLLTAKFIKPVSELAGASQDHKTLPDLLRRYGYRTAAFYPPAVFYVDGARFRALADRGFGFEYRKEMFASADERVAQLTAYLEVAEPNHPLFVWIHLFEPHEPYDPPDALETSDSARGRYEGEVRAADRAIGRLVRAFRAVHPNGTVIVSADHGEEFGDHGGSYHGTTLFEEQVHVPLLWSSPGAVRAGVSDAPVELVDVGSTILSSAGVQRDARMRGDDLSALLAGAQGGPKYAFASVEERHMVSDGRYKAICSASSAHCQLFDLAHDPKEQRNLAGEQPERVAELRRALFLFLSSIAQREVLAVAQGVSFPEALVRARLGAPGSGADVVPLLKDARASVRAASARILGELGIVAAQPLLSSLAQRDADAQVRDEAAIAALTLGAEAVHEQVAALLTRHDQGPEALLQRRRAALALARAPRKDARAVPWLNAWARDASAQESDRLHAVNALGALQDRSAVETLTALLAEVRLREAVAHALSEIGGPEAQEALFSALSAERYEPARSAEARALTKLGDPRVAAQIERFLGMDTSIPGGVRMLMELGLLQPASARGGLVALSPRRGTFSCDAGGCVSGASARIVLPASAGARRQRITLLIDSSQPGAPITLDGTTYRSAGGEQQLSFVRSDKLRELSVESDGRVTLIAWVSVPEQAEIPPPAPEPWDAGVEARGSAREQNSDAAADAQADAQVAAQGAQGSAGAPSWPGTPAR